MKYSENDKGQLNEIDLFSAIKNLAGKLSSKNDNISKEFAKIVSDQFEGDFGNYLKRYLVKKGKQTDVIQILLDYFKSPNESNYDDVYSILGEPMVQYFLKKTFGKESFSARIKQITPFLKKVSTGSRKLDNEIFMALSDAMSEQEVESAFKSDLKSVIDDKLRGALDDQDFYDFLGDLMDDNGSEDLDEVTAVGKGVQNVKRGFRDVFASSENKDKWRLTDTIIDTIDGLRKPLKRALKDEIFNLKYSDVRKILKNSEYGNIIPKILTKIILRHIIIKAKDLYFKEDYLAELTDVVKTVFGSKIITREVKKAIESFYRSKQKEIEKKAIDKEKKNLQKKIKKQKKLSRKDSLKKYQQQIKQLKNRDQSFKDMFNL